jgi:transcriptional regulator NrdR family protein
MALTSKFTGVTMSCPDCGKKTAVADSRRVSGGVRRRRVCEDGHRYFTVERPESEEYKEEISRLNIEVEELHRLVGMLTLENTKLKGGPEWLATG